MKKMEMEMEIEKEAQHLKAAKARSTCEVFIMMKMLDTQVGQLAERPMGNKEVSETTPRSQDGEGYSSSFGRDEGSH
jgi:hypothetical protein